jgi:predicted NAD/FAD-dependent oxidoreductase
MAGLAAARLLREAGADCTIFDKSRGLGGRMATRRTGDFSFDHGAQYFTARGPRFRSLVDEWSAAGHAASWYDHEVIVGAPGMTAAARAMAAGLNTVMGLEVKSLSRAPQGWSIHAGEEVFEGFTAVVVAIPAPQAMSLIKTGGLSFPELASARYAPCLALMLAFDAKAAFQGERMCRDKGPIAWIARNSSKPGRPAGQETFVVHASPDWSRAHLDETPEAILKKLSPFALDLISALSAPIFATAHRWRYALVEQALAVPCLWDAEAAVGACGDYCLGPRVEAAFDSGEAMARAILDTWSHHDSV